MLFRPFRVREPLFVARCRIDHSPLWGVPHYQNFSAFSGAFIKFDKLCENPAVFWNVDFYQDDDGNLPVRKWLETMPEDVRGKVIARLDLLRQGGPTLDYPYTSQIDRRLREVRLGRQNAL
jgi:Phage derived protein Gp49-like (DUF891)